MKYAVIVWDEGHSEVFADFAYYSLLAAEKYALDAAFGGSPTTICCLWSDQTWTPLRSIRAEWH